MVLHEAYLPTFNNPIYEVGVGIEYIGGKTITIGSWAPL